MTFCVLTPRLPPAIDGIGDYCHQLWRHVQQRKFVTTNWQFIVMDGAEATLRAWPEANCRQIEPNTEALIATLNALHSHTVLIQYVGYGYAPDGAPMWLAEGLERWKKEEAGRAVAIMFHETWSNGKIWQRAFWQRKKQQNCVRALLSIADVVVTSIMANADSLRQLGYEGWIEIIPIGSSFSLDAAVAKDWRRALIFGKYPSRKVAVNRHSELLKLLGSSKRLDCVVLAGQRDPDGQEIHELRSLGITCNIERYYDFAPDAVPEQILQSGLSFMHTESPNLLKSTSFQLCAQVGQVAIAREEGPCDDPFTTGVHFLSYRAGTEQAMLRLLDNTQLLEAIAAQCHHAGSERLSWDAITDKWLQTLRGIIT